MDEGEECVEAWIVAGWGEPEPEPEPEPDAMRTAAPTAAASAECGHELEGALPLPTTKRQRAADVDTPAAHASGAPFHGLS